MTKQIFVQEYTRADGTKVRSHYRNIEETANMLSQGNSQGALDLINQTLSTIPEEKNALAQLFSEGNLNSDEKTAIMEQLQYLQSFQNEAGRYQTLADNNFDTTSASDRIKEMFSGQPTGGAAEIRNQPLKYTEMTSLPPTHSPEYEKLNFIDKMFVDLLENKTENFPITQMQLQNGLSNMKGVYKNPDVKVYYNLSDVEDTKLKEELKAIGVKEEHKGCLLKENSYYAKTMSNSKAVKNCFNENKRDIEQGKLTTAKVTFPILDNLDSKENDLGLSFHNVTLTNMKIENGFASADLIDLGDYKDENGMYYGNKGYYGTSKNSDKYKSKYSTSYPNAFILDVNNRANELQEKGVMKPVFYIAKIKFKV